MSRKRRNGGGTLIDRGGGCYTLIFDLPSILKDGKRKRQQKWVTFRATPNAKKREQRKEAQAKLRELLHSRDNGTFVEPSKLTLIDYLRSWMDTSVKPPMRRQATYDTYLSLIDNHVAESSIAAMPLQRLRSGDIERFYAGLKLSPASIEVLHAIFSRSLRKVVKDRLLTLNPAVDLERQRKTPDHSEARQHCWSATEAQRVLEAAKAAPPQLAAFVFLALDSGARKGELFGLAWEHLDCHRHSHDHAATRQGR